MDASNTGNHNKELFPNCNVAFSDDSNASDIDIDEIVASITTSQRFDFNSTKSLFNIALDGFREKSNEEIDRYKESAQKVEKEWIDFIIGCIDVFKETIAKHATPFQCEPSKDQQAYLDQMPDLQNFLRNSVAFVKDATTFLEKDHAEMSELQLSLMDACQHILNSESRIRLNENLAASDCTERH
ncbi:uncharacterized protein LOC115628884 [Scaptodrosophila lebanonensis]|uniref:Uncharacterized protein LOC115628884 n=1 Tax=Drosophila lebanonensis TaxID=7225 RepID=A0A6J2TZA1_DROLE|nr:uncharacterized protein LOC115628884 [Scaptodrosophila lebanonensis]